MLADCSRTELKLKSVTWIWMWPMSLRCYVAYRERLLPAVCTRTRQRHGVSVTVSASRCQRYDVSVMTSASRCQRHDVSVTVSALWRQRHNISVTVSASWRHRHGVSVTCSWWHYSVVGSRRPWCQQHVSRRHQLSVCSSGLRHRGRQHARPVRYWRCDGARVGSQWLGSSRRTRLSLARVSCEPRAGRQNSQRRPRTQELRQPHYRYRHIGTTVGDQWWWWWLGSHSSQTSKCLSCLRFFCVSVMLVSQLFNGHIKTAQQRTVMQPLMGGLLILVQQGGPGRAAAPPRPSSLYQM